MEATPSKHKIKRGCYGGLLRSPGPLGFAQQPAPDGSCCRKEGGGCRQPLFPRLVGALLAPPPRDRRDSEAQHETGAVWREQHAGRGCARVSLPGGRRRGRRGTSVLQRAVGDQSPARPAGQRQGTADSQISPSTVLHTWLTPPLKVRPHALGARGGILLSALPAEPSQLSPLAVTNAAGLPAGIRVENRVGGLQQGHAPASSPSSTPAERRHRAGALCVTTAVTPGAIPAKKQIQRFKYDIILFQSFQHIL